MSKLLKERWNRLAFGKGNQSTNESDPMHIQEHVGDESHEHGAGSHAAEPYEGYVEEGANMYAQDEDFDGYIKFGKKFGYTEEQLEEWYDIEYEEVYQAWSADQDAGPNVGHMDQDQLERDFESGDVDLQKRPYQLD
tara:strand:+ start:142 stop:552 length:411 start_codon:yes stop_codon:yes gene_type:complete